MKKIVFIIFVLMATQTACSNKNVEYNSDINKSYSTISNGSEIVSDNETENNTNSGINKTEVPQKEEVMLMRNIALKGMSEEDAENLCIVIKKANQTIEIAAIYNNFFEHLSDPDSLMWNYFDESGEIQVGWGYDGKLSIQEVMEKEGITEEEFYEKYGQKVIAFNDYSAEDFAELLENINCSVLNEAMHCDLQKIINKTRLAAKTHDVEYVKNIYFLLHDMDYFLLNYRLDTEGQYISNKSTISKYYGVLTIYDE